MKRWKTMVYRAGFEALYRTGAHRLDALRSEGLGMILTLHHVRPAAPGAYSPNRELEITPEFLETAIHAMRNEGVQFVSLDEVSRRLADPAPTGRFAAVTLDDGYRDNREIVLPVLRRLGVPFTVFVTSRFVTRRAIVWWKVVEEVIGLLPEVEFTFETETRMYRTRSVAEKEKAADLISTWARGADPDLVIERVTDFATRYGVDPMGPTNREVMTPVELADLASDPIVTIGAHTLTHPNLARLGESAAMAEMIGGANELADIIGVRPTHFAYPYGYPGAASEREFRLTVEAGFDLGLTTRPGMLHPQHRAQRTALPRVSLNGNFQSQEFLDVLMSGAPFTLMDRLKRRRAA
jgi:peptidoglycan/xylan/chitin deacetylase (PgdA/CDA1 family)